MCRHHVKLGVRWHEDHCNRCKRQANLPHTLQGIGNIFSIDEDLLGATVLAWGETFPDLMAMIAVARAGKLSVSQTNNLNPDSCVLLQQLPNS